MLRRNFLALIGFIGFGAYMFNKQNELKKVIKDKFELGLHWPTKDPFLFCAHHLDHFPEGTSNQSVPEKYLKGRNLGQDFGLKDGFRMYHGTEIPGFPVHPHRGFETITIVNKGYVDHADSLGAAGRYGEGDVQWMTAGSGVQHSEMFPLLDQENKNIVQMFQVWLNLPARNKMVDADFKMLWGNDIPKIRSEKDGYELSIISGEYNGQSFFQAPKNSWAADPENKINVFLLTLEQNGNFSLPAIESNSNRMIYFYEGESFEVNSETISQGYGIDCYVDEKIEIKASAKSKVLILEGKAINEPVVQQGPFVLNSSEELIQTFNDYQKTQFGGWTWERTDMVHGNEKKRFAKYPDGKIIYPTKS